MNVYCDPASTDWRWPIDSQTAQTVNASCDQGSTGRHFAELPMHNQDRGAGWVSNAPSMRRLTGGGSAASDEPKARNESAAPAG